MPAPLRRLEPGPAPRPDENLEDWLDAVDVPATVVCARCGVAECGGCGGEPKTGIVSVLAWEREASGSVFARLWATARPATLESEAFFASLPDGPIGPALRFAFLSELVAATAMVLGFGTLFAALLPSFVAAELRDPAVVASVARAFVVGVPLMAVVLVLAHAIHGLSLDVGARRNGALFGNGATRRALRFGLYACGWDLVLGAPGAIVLAVRERTKGLSLLAKAARGLPTRSSTAFLRGTYGLTGAPASSALKTSYVAAVLATILAGAALVAIAVSCFR